MRRADWGLSLARPGELVSHRRGGACVSRALGLAFSGRLRRRQQIVAVNPAADDRSDSRASCIVSSQPASHGRRDARWSRGLSVPAHAHGWSKYVCVHHPRQRISKAARCHMSMLPCSHTPVVQCVVWSCLYLLCKQRIAWATQHCD